jgi:hypothetical protein
MVQYTPIVSFSIQTVLQSLDYVPISGRYQNWGNLGKIPVV